VLRNNEGECFELPDVQNAVGRGAACNVCIPGSQAISNRHASISIDREGVSSVKDLGSRNGTFLNDRRVPQDSSYVVQSGDQIQLGIDGPTFLFEFGPAYYARWPQDPERIRSQAARSAPTPAGPRHQSSSPAPNGRRGR